MVWDGDERGFVGDGVVAYPSVAACLAPDRFAVVAGVESDRVPVDEAVGTGVVGLASVDAVEPDVAGVIVWIT